MVVKPAKVTAAAEEIGTVVLEADPATMGMFMPSKLISPFMLRGLIFSIQSRSDASPFPSTVGTVESAPIDMPTIDARSSKASLLAVKSTTSSFVTPVGGLFVPLEVTSDCPPFKLRDDVFEMFDDTPDEELDEEKLEVFDNLEAILWPEDPEIPDSGELMFKSDTFLLLLLLLMMILLLLLLLVLVVKTGSRPVRDVAS